MSIDIIHDLLVTFIDFIVVFFVPFGMLKFPRDEINIFAFLLKC